MTWNTNSTHGQNITKQTHNTSEQMTNTSAESSTMSRQHIQIQHFIQKPTPNKVTHIEII